MLTITIATCSFSFTLNGSVTLLWSVEARFLWGNYSFPAVDFVTLKISCFAGILLESAMVLYWLPLTCLKYPFWSWKLICAFLDTTWLLSLSTFVGFQQILGGKEIDAPLKGQVNETYDLWLDILWSVLVLDNSSRHFHSSTKSPLLFLYIKRKSSKNAVLNMFSF